MKINGYQLGAGIFCLMSFQFSLIGGVIFDNNLIILLSIICGLAGIYSIGNAFENDEYKEEDKNSEVEK